MLVSVVIPAYHAELTLAEAARSVLAQSFTGWECIVVSDDGVDYGALLAAAGLTDPRLRFVSTGRKGSGCHAARNRGLGECRGDVIGHLDADDVWMPSRLAVLAPQAMQLGAAVDGPRVVDAGDGRVLYSAFDALHPPLLLDVAHVLDLNCPIFPVTRRDVSFARVPGIEYLEEIVGNLRLISAIGPIPAVAEPLMDYRVVTGSMCHADDSAARFEEAYADLIARIREDRLDIAATLRTDAIAGLERKRALNQRFGAAQRLDGRLNFQTFVAGLRRSLTAS